MDPEPAGKEGIGFAALGSLVSDITPLLTQVDAAIASATEQKEWAQRFPPAPSGRAPVVSAPISIPNPSSAAFQVGKAMSAIFGGLLPIALRNPIATFVLLVLGVGWVVGQFRESPRTSQSSASRPAAGAPYVAPSPSPDQVRQYFAEPSPKPPKKTRAAAATVRESSPRPWPARP